jgi:hypothetical protein
MARYKADSVPSDVLDSYQHGQLQLIVNNPKGIDDIDALDWKVTSATGRARTVRNVQRS